MKLQDPRLEQLLAAYREDRRPGEAQRERMWQRFDDARRPVRVWPKGVIAAVVAVAAIAIVWLAVRGWSGALARPGAGDPDVQAPFGVEPARTGGVAPVQGGRAAVEGTPGGAAEPPPATSVTIESEHDRPAKRTSPRPSGVGSLPATEEPESAAAAEQQPHARGDDLVLIEAAEAALRAAEPAKALALLRQHEQRFPDAPTVEERLALRVLALCAAGRSAEGRGARWAFLREHPDSAYRERIESACPQP
jgi:hypothetical protein